MRKHFAPLLLVLILIMMFLPNCTGEALVEAPAGLSLPDVTPRPAGTATLTLPTRTLIPTFTPSPPPTFTPTATPSPTVTPSPIPTATSTPSVTPTPSLEPTITPSTEELSIPNLELKPGDPIPYLETFRLVTYYGSPTGWGLGILGEYNRDYMTWELSQVALEYQALSPDHFVIPTYHMVTTVADGYPGTDEDYNHHVSMETIEDWVTVANETGVACVLDIQPAHADIQTEFDRVKHLLAFPHVHLAIDPEFVMEEGQIPGQHLGRMTAEQINLIQAQLNDIALEVGVNRVLIIHQFEDYMLPDKDLLGDFPHVELVIDADGVSDTWNKLYDYKQYVLEPNFEYAGIKIFYKKDTPPLLTPEELMWLEPPPAVIIYQ